MPDTSAATRTADQRMQLERLRERWTAELQNLIGRSPDCALHLAEALEDLERFIASIESAGPPPRADDQAR